MFLIHFGDYGGGGSDRLISHKYGTAGLNIGDPVVVNNRDNIRLLQPGNSLPEFIVINKNNLFLPWPDRTAS